MDASTNSTYRQLIEDAMKLLWHDVAWDDYLYWHTHDKQAVKRIHMPIKDIQRNGYVGIGKPEPLKANLQGWWESPH